MVTQTKIRIRGFFGVDSCSQHSRPKHPRRHVRERNAAGCPEMPGTKWLQRVDPHCQLRSKLWRKVRTPAQKKRRNDKRRGHREQDGQYRRRPKKPGNWLTWRPLQQRRLHGKVSQRADRQREAKGSREAVVASTRVGESSLGPSVNFRAWFWGAACDVCQGEASRLGW